MNPKSTITIFTDGSSRGNPGPGGWGAIIIMNDDSQTNSVFELGGGEKNTTNNRMEMMAAISALSFLNTKPLYPKPYTLLLYTDSSYLINGITKWVFGWQKNGWKTKTKEEVSNRDLWEELSKLSEKFKIEWKHVGGHIGIVGNERCDEIATQFADLTQTGRGLNAEKEIILYNGPLSNYKLDIISVETNGDQIKKKVSSSAKAYSYISMIDGAIETHKTWAECERRVKGAKGAKYKKVFSEKEEKELVKTWSASRK